MGGPPKLRTEILRMESNREKAKRWRRLKIHKKALIKILERKKKERLEV